VAELTQRQRQILELVQDVIDATGMPPTRAEIARKLGFKSANASEDHLRALARKGMIELLPGAARGIRLTDPPGLPVVGRVAAGSPILAQEHVEGRYRLDPSLFHPKPHYLLRVRGMSMRDAGILDGDLLAVHRTPDVYNGQIVVARLGDEVTVKRYRLKGSQVWLMPENPDFQPIILDASSASLMLEGVVVGVIRNGLPAGDKTG
jgi:repressor LexA